MDELLTPVQLAFTAAREHQRQAQAASNEIEAAHHSAEMRRFDKAAEQLARGAEITAMDNGYYITSRSRSDVYYVTPTTCTCEAGLKGKQCWHMATAETLSLCQVKTPELEPALEHAH